jgi:uncharacterized protein YecE (DUF72 family)
VRILAGTSGYSYPAWKGSFYPEDIPSGEMLRHYATKLPAVEINNTFYRLPTPSLLAGWAEQVPESFRFALKASQKITHIRRLKGAGDETRFLLESAQKLGPRLGPILFGLPPNLKKDVPRLASFLELLPAGVRAAFEFRNVSWFDDEVYAALRAKNVALCVAEAEDLTVPFVATADWGYLRLRRQDYDDAAVATWARSVRAQAWTEAFVFFKHEDEGTGPKLAARFLEIVNAGDAP